MIILLCFLMEICYGHFFSFSIVNHLISDVKRRMLKYLHHFRNIHIKINWFAKSLKKMSSVLFMAGDISLHNMIKCKGVSCAHLISVFAGDKLLLCSFIFLPVPWFRKSLS